MSRLAETFARLKKDGRAAFVPFITACDPDPETSLAILSGLPGAGADIIELGMAFTDPMADGPAVQMSSTRALAAGYSTLKLLDMVKKFRKADNKTPIVLMGYFNPIHAYGAARFAKDAAAAGVDGIICVDLPPEEDEVLRVPAAGQGTLIFLETSEAEARRRIVRRDLAKGRSEAEIVRRIEQRYFPSQARYRQACAPRDRADIVIDNERPAEPRGIKRDLGRLPPELREILARLVPAPADR